MPFLLDLGRLRRLGGLHQRLHGVDPFVEMRKATLAAPPVDALFASRRRKVKQMRGFLDG
jgi:hypothetical protein